MPVHTTLCTEAYVQYTHSTCQSNCCTHKEGMTRATYTMYTMYMYMYSYMYMYMYVYVYM